MLELILSNLPVIITGLLALGFVWKHISKVLTLVKEVNDVCAAILTAMSDKRITQDEIDEITKEGKEVVTAVRELLDKKE